MIGKKETGIKLLEEVISSLENPKNSLFGNFQKLNRIGRLLDEDELIKWTEVQFGNTRYTIPIKKYIDCFLNNEKEKSKSSQKALGKAQAELDKVGIDLTQLFQNDELTAKAVDSGGGFNNIGYVEERYSDIVKNKRGNDGTLYQSNLLLTLSTVRAVAFKKASRFHRKYAYESLPETNFELLKKEVEDVLFELDPELTEMLLVAFKSVSSQKQEEWSQAHISSRRFLERLADNLFPPQDTLHNGRKVDKENYINRLWAFMDIKITSKSNRETAKAHIDFLGSYVQNLYRISNKGIHSSLSRFDSMKSVMHIYLACAELLNFIDKDDFANAKPSIYTASLDELMVIAIVSKNIAKDIIRLRVKRQIINEDHLKQIPGVGPKTLKRIIDNLSFERLLILNSNIVINAKEVWRQGVLVKCSVEM